MLTSCRSAGAIVGFKDYAKLLIHNNLTIGRNGSEKIGGDSI